VEVRGLQAYVLGRLRLGSRLTSYAQAGRSFYHSEFFESPGWSAPGRRFVVADTKGWLAAAGCTVALVRHVDLEASYRHSWTGDVEARAYLRPNRYREGAFPMRNDAVSLGAAYSF
jgi:opacity protein-like surface antigen